VKIQDKGKWGTFALFLAQLPFNYSVVLAKRWPDYLPHPNQALLVGMAFDKAHQASTPGCHWLWHHCLARSSSCPR
jgi:hypothetical protein